MNCSSTCRAKAVLTLALALTALSGWCAGAEPDPDGAALQLANLAQSAPTHPVRDWQLAIEGAIGTSHQRYGLDDVATQRLSLDLQIDRKLAPDWRAVLSDQLDLRWSRQFESQTRTNTLREAYLSWQATADRALDIGRVNARFGVASGYSPSDFFRSGANRSVVSLDPTSLKKNRQGSVMLRGQTLWNGGALTALLSPRLAERPDSGDFSLGLGATNGSDRWLLALSQRLNDGLTPQWLLFGQNQQAPQLGFNLTGVPGSATVAYVEWAGGHSVSQLAQALQTPGDAAFRSRLAVGATYTTPNKVSLTLEYDYNGAAPDADEWTALGQRHPQAYAKYRQWTQTQFDLPTRQSVFLYANWQDAMVSQLDLNAMLRYNADDHSRLWWLEARYHWRRFDLALQWQQHSGAPTSEFGALGQEQALQLVLRYFY